MTPRNSHFNIRQLACSPESHPILCSFFFLSFVCVCARVRMKEEENTIKMLNEKATHEPCSKTKNRKEMETNRNMK